jgi:hypothetical protein
MGKSSTGIKTKKSRVEYNKLSKKFAMDWYKGCRKRFGYLIAMIREFKAVSCRSTSETQKSTPLKFATLPPGPVMSRRPPVAWSRGRMRNKRSG